jgi:hypothetical protein
MDKTPVYLYSDRPAEFLDLEKVDKYLINLGFTSEIKGDFVNSIGFSHRKLALKLSKCRVVDLLIDGGLNLDPSDNDIADETRILKSRKPDQLKKDFSNLCDGFALSRAFRSSIKNRGFHIIFTSRMIASYEGTRYHGRTIIVDYPISIISTTGIIEAPAKPREYYIKKIAYERVKVAGLRVPSEEDYNMDLKKEYRGRFIDYDDPLITRVSIGLALQALFYLFFGEVFCKNPDCQLYNAHTQEDLIRAQIYHGKLCERHKIMLDKKK